MSDLRVINIQSPNAQPLTSDSLRQLARLIAQSIRERIEAGELQVVSGVVCDKMSSKRKS